MKNTMKSKKGFTLIEMLGVLAIIAILVSIVAVGVLKAINRSRIVSTVANFKTYETAMLAFVTLPETLGFLPITEGASNYTTSVPTIGGTPGANATDPDLYTLGQVFLGAGVLERMPTFRVGRELPFASGSDVQAVWSQSDVAWLDTPVANAKFTTQKKARCEAVVATATIGLGTNFALGGGGTASVPVGATIAYVVVPQVSSADAVELSKEVNGSLNKATLTNVKQDDGRLTFAVASGGMTDVYYYIGNM